jgi:multisubunit Na+/H+ antiporter MnhF subunit
MIDTWLFAALVLGVLALCIVLRGMRSRLQEDRLVAGTVAVTLAAMTALTLSIASGTLVILDIGIGITLIAFAAMIWANRQGVARP